MDTEHEGEQPDETEDGPTEAPAELPTEVEGPGGKVRLRDASTVRLAIRQVIAEASVQSSVTAGAAALAMLWPRLGKRLRWGWDAHEYGAACMDKLADAGWTMQQQRAAGLVALAHIGRSVPWGGPEVKEAKDF